MPLLEIVTICFLLLDSIYHLGMNDTVLMQLLKQLTSIVPTSRKGMLKEVDLIISDHLVQATDSHNTSSAIYVFSTSEDTYLLKVEYGNENATAKEIQWYKATLSGMPCPTLVASFSRDDYAFLVLQHIEGAKTLDELADEEHITAKSLPDYIDIALTKDRELFSNSKPVVVGSGETDQFYLEKYKRRSQEAHKFTYLKSLLDTPAHIVNGNMLRSPTYYISRIASNSKLHEYLTPRELGLIHGDLHCGNILAKGNLIYFVDPNGVLRMPIEYDYGKILHSIHGGYHEIMKQRYSLEISKNGFSFDVEIPKAYTAALGRVQSQLTEQELLRGFYAEGMHFATLLPHHATERRETTALFLRCIQIFDELFYNLNIK